MWLCWLNRGGSLGRKEKLFGRELLLRSMVRTNGGGGPILAQDLVGQVCGVLLCLLEMLLPSGGKSWLKG